MKSDQTIKQLVADLPAVRKPLDAKLSVLLWLVSSLLFLGAVFAGFLTLRDDLVTMWGRAWFVLNLFSLAIVFVLASYVGFVSSIPGRARPRAALLGVQLALLVFFGTLLPSLMHMPMSGMVRAGLNLHSGMKCTGALAALGLIPAVGLFFAIRRLAPVTPGTTARMIGLAFGALGAFALGFDCMVLNPVHLVVYHGLPILLLGGLGTIVGRRILRW